jgi:hypothetical protein
MRAEALPAAASSHTQMFKITTIEVRQTEHIRLRARSVLIGVDLHSCVTSADGALGVQKAISGGEAHTI